MSAPLYGLVMAGGHSRRMGRDKARLDYHGVPQAQWAARLLEEIGLSVFISCREDQDLGFPAVRIHDPLPGQGPMGGLLAAHEVQPGFAWLVVACDLPRLTSDGLRSLVDARRPEAWATAYESADGLPEPLCAIYEPVAFPALRAAFDHGQRCPRRLLIAWAGRAHRVPLPHPNLLDNANTPEEAEALQKRMAL